MTCETVGAVEIGCKRSELKCQKYSKTQPNRTFSLEDLGDVRRISSERQIRSIIHGY